MTKHIRAEPYGDRKWHQHTCRRWQALPPSCHSAGWDGNTDIRGLIWLQFDVIIAYFSSMLVSVFLKGGGLSKKLVWTGIRYGAVLFFLASVIECGTLPGSVEGLTVGRLQSDIIRICFILAYIWRVLRLRGAGLIHSGLGNMHHKFCLSCLPWMSLT